MKSVRSAIVLSAIVLASAGTAAAQSSTADKPITAADKSTAAGDMVGRHSMQGEVTSVDANKGWIHLKTEEGTMIVHLPPSALQDVKKGDTITLNLALKDNGPRK